MYVKEKKEKEQYAYLQENAINQQSGVAARLSSAHEKLKAAETSNASRIRRTIK